jgi:diguanylate cyclase (GGDEF)-like protein
VVAGCCVVTLLSMVAATWYGLSQTRRVMVQQVRAAERLLADERADALARTVDQSHERLRSLARQPAVSAALLAPTSEALEALLSTAMSLPGVARLEAYDVAGRRVAATDGPAPAGPEQLVFPADTRHDAYVVLAADIVDATGRGVGRIVETMSIRALLPEFATMTSMASGLVTLARVDGTVLLSARPKPAPVLTGEPLVAAVQARRPAVLSYRSPMLGRRRIAAVAPVPGGDMAVIAGADESEAYQPARQLTLRLAAVVAVTMLVATVTALVVTGSIRRGRRQLEAERAVAEQLARVDPLTAVGNRRAFDAMLEDVRDTDLQAQVVVIDLDDFKELNDTLGHVAGDRALRAVADALVERVRDTDTIARVGGDEFVVVQTSTSRRDHDLADRVHEALAVTTVDDHPVRATIGYAAGAAATIELLVVDADADLYRNKRARNVGRTTR